jgi:nucleoid DNA-binding protein/cell division septation protein DedD
MKIEKYLIELLKKHECVIVPNFGAFISHHVASVHHPSENKFYPPSKNISFNRLLTTNDGLLIQHIATATNTSYTEAQSKINALATEWNEALESNQNIILKGLGKLYKQLDNKIHFIPDITENLSLKAYGLVATKHIAIDRSAQEAIVKKVATPTISIKKSNNKKLELERRNKNRRRKYTYAILSCLILALGFSQLFFFTKAPVHMNEASFISFINTHKSNNDKLNSVFVSHSIVSLPKTKEIISSTTKVETPITENLVTNVPTTNNTVKETITPPIENNTNTFQAGYYIVLGTFSEQKNANKLCSKISKEGKIAYRKRNANGSTLVAEFASANKEEASALLKSKQAEQADVWLKLVK